MSNQITYTKGDATQPVGNGNKIIVHICNDIGKWGKGFVIAISKRWPGLEQQYRHITFKRIWYLIKTIRLYNFALSEWI